MKKLLILLILISGCGMMKNTSSNSQKTNQLSSIGTTLQLQQQQDLSHVSRKLILKKDSGSLEYAVEIWPKGDVFFSSQRGFSGQAEKIIVTGKANKRITAALLSSAEEHDKSKRAATVNQKYETKKNQSSQSKTSSPAWKWQLAGLLLIAVAGWFVYKKLKL